MKISFEKAKQLIRSGHVVAVPTETVYGLAASIQFPDAVTKIFDIKGRPADKPLIVHISSYAQLQEIVKTVPKSFEKIKKFWPGPLTVVFEANLEKVPEIVRAGGTTVAIRIPGHELLLKFIEQTGPLAAPSANISGHPSPTSAEDVLDNLGDDFAVLDGGACQYGVESTLIKLNDQSWELLREGAVSKADLDKSL